MMESDKIKSFAGQLKTLVGANKDFPQKLEKRLVSGFRKVKNQSKFIAELFKEGVLCDGSNDVEMIVHLAVTIGCSKGADGIGGMLRALESSGNSQLVSALQIWAKRDFQIKTDDDGSPSEAEGGTSAFKNLPRKKLRRNVASPTELSLPNPPRPAATGLFAATTEGLIALDLHTLEATVLTSEYTRAVAVNHKLEKVYWTEGWPNSSIVRSNFDGSAKEMIVPSTATGDMIMTLAIDETSGNVYFALSESGDINCCGERGRNCVVVSDSSLVNLPSALALDSVNGFMYSGIISDSGSHSVLRAKLDGSNATIISTGFECLCSITLEQPSSGVLYWTDGEEKATLGTVDVNGGNKQTLVELEGDAGPEAIQVDAHKIYFCNSVGTSIHSVNRDTGEELTTIFKSKGYVFDLALFSAPA